MLTPMRSFSASAFATSSSFQLASETKKNTNLLQNSSLTSKLYDQLWCGNGSSTETLGFGTTEDLDSCHGFRVASQATEKLTRHEPQFDGRISTEKRLRSLEISTRESVEIITSLPASENVLLVDVNASHKIVVTFQLWHNKQSLSETLHVRTSLRLRF